MKNNSSEDQTGSGGPHGLRRFTDGKKQQVGSKSTRRQEWQVSSPEAANPWSNAGATPLRRKKETRASSKCLCSRCLETEGPRAKKEFDRGCRVCLMLTSLLRRLIFVIL